VDFLGDIMEGACNFGIYHAEIVEEADPEFDEARGGVDLIETVPKDLPRGGSCCFFCPGANVGGCLEEAPVNIERMAGPLSMKPDIGNPKGKLVRALLKWCSHGVISFVFVA
jgi:hypothetical protein